MIRCVNCRLPIAPIQDPNDIADGRPDLEKKWIGWIHSPGIGITCPPRKATPEDSNAYMGIVYPGFAQPEEGITYEDYFKREQEKQG